jgi:hypothetical protein
MVGNYDAAAATLLQGNGKGTFSVMPHTVDGLRVRGESRKMVYWKDNKTLIILKNSALAQVYRLN